MPGPRGTSVGCELMRRRVSSTVGRVVLYVGDCAGSEVNVEPKGDRNRGRTQAPRNPRRSLGD